MIATHEWEEATSRGLVGSVRAGRSLLPAPRRGGACCAGALPFASGHETNGLRNSGASLARLSWGRKWRAAWYWADKEGVDAPRGECSFLQAQHCAAEFRLRGTK